MNRWCTKSMQRLPVVGGALVGPPVGPAVGVSLWEVSSPAIRIDIICHANI